MRMLRGEVSVARLSAGGTILTNKEAELVSVDVRRELGGGGMCFSVFHERRQNT
jgi:hypothetical protein